MAEKKGFDLAALMKGVADLNDGQAERIELLPFESLREDPGNFYSMDGLEALADSISTVGLLDPIRVRQEEGHYVVISGHRRRAAIGILIAGGEERWKEAVPCIVDRGEELPELTRLKLIMANSATRQKTSAELSREAEEIKELLIGLREKGFPLPGRLSSYVAEAIGVKESKLKRLHAIRGNLIPELLALYDANTINEETAYQLQQLPEGVQRYLAAQKKVKAGNIYGTGAKACVEKCETYLHPDCKCRGGSECTHTYPRFYQTISTDMAYWRCHGECCLKCNRSLSECPYQCKRAKDEAERKKEKEKAEKLSAEERRKKALDENRAVLAGQYMRLAFLAEAAGLKDSETIYIDGAQTVGDLKAVAADPSRINDYKARETHVFGEYSYVRTAANLADKLGVSVDFLLGRTEEPGVNRGEDRAAEDVGPYKADEGAKGAAAATWSRGTPTEEGWYACLGKWRTLPDREIAYWWNGAWYEKKRKIRVMAETEVTAFYRLPDVEDFEK